jgi:hypothetical protein
MPDQCCQPCKYVFDLSLGHLSVHRELWLGVCHRLHFPALMNEDSEQLDAPSKRRRVATDRYVTAPSKIKMPNEYYNRASRDAADKKRKSRALREVQSNLQDREIDRAIASRFVAAAASAGATDDGADKENKKKIAISLPNGGQSKAAVYKRKKLAGQVLNGMAKQIGGSKASAFREEAITTTTSLKQKPFLMGDDPE